MVMPWCYIIVYGLTNGFRLFVFKAHFARLRFWKAAVDSNGPCVAFPSKGDAVLWHGKWTTLIPWEVCPVIFFLWTGKSSGLFVWVIWQIRWPTFLLGSTLLIPFRQSARKGNPPPFISRYLSLQAESEQGLSVFPRKPEPLIINSNASTGKNV